MGNIDPGVIGVFIPIVAIVAGVGFALAQRWFRHKERIAMIQMGMHPDHPELEAGEGGELDLELEPGPERSRDRT
ncbi:MAG: hypothetical protein V3V67_08275 [Myxococcota bacterium]